MKGLNSDLEVELVDFDELFQENETYNSDPNETDDDEEEDVKLKVDIRSPQRLMSSLKDDIRSYSRIPQLNAPLLVPQRTNCITDELFQITKKKSKLDQDNGILQGRKLNNSIMVNVVQAINGQRAESLQGADWELDDQLRSRFYKGRPTPSVTTKSDRDLERTLDNFLVDSDPINFEKENIVPLTKKKVNRREDDNKENFNSGTRKGNFTPLKQGRNDNNSIKLDSNKSIPVLRPLTNNRQRNGNPFDGFMIMSKQFSKARSLINSEQVIGGARFEPRHRQIKHPLKPILKHKQLENQLTFIVDSLTGSVHDATQFGTELNSVNCNGFPLPETTNEIVQIPTSEGKPEEQKVAFIKAFKIVPMIQQETDTNMTKNNSTLTELNALGYYSYNKYLESREQDNKITGNGVEIQTQLPTIRKRRGRFHNEDEDESLMLSSSSLERSSSPVQIDREASSPLKKRKVQWSTNLEW